MKLCENTRVYLKESDNYGFLTDTFKNDGFGSTCNTEAASMLLKQRCQLQREAFL